MKYNELQECSNYGSKQFAKDRVQFPCTGTEWDNDMAAMRS